MNVKIIDLEPGGEYEFINRITEEFNKSRDIQQKVSEILFPFICNEHGKFYISMERIKDYNNWCAECYHDRSRLTIEQIIAKGKKYNFNLETPLSYINYTIKTYYKREYTLSFIIIYLCGIDGGLVS